MPSVNAVPAGNTDAALKCQAVILRFRPRIQKLTKAEKYDELMDLLHAYDSDEEELSSAKRQVVPTRVRSFPHVEGNYATHVFTRVELPAGMQPTLREVLYQARQKLPSLQVGTDALPSNNQAIADIPTTYHLSLSRVTAIRFRDRDSLISSLKDCLEKTKSFDLELDQMEAFTNDEHTRSFLALSVGKGRSQVCKAIARVNEVFLQHGLPRFYEDPRPHVSIAWLLGNQERALQDHIRAKQRLHTGSGLAGRQARWIQTVASIECKVGQNVFIVWKPSATT